MKKRKTIDVHDSSRAKKFRVDVKGPFNDPLLRESVVLSMQNTKRRGQSRKDKRKEAKLLKKMRKDAFHHGKAIPTKEDFIKAKQEIAMDEKKEREKKRKKEQRKKQKKEKKRKKQMEKRKIEEKQQQEADELEAVKARDDREIRDLEKKLHLNKRKTKTLPQSFLNDGLDYILDVVDSEKLEEMANIGEESDLEEEMSNKNLEDDDLDNSSSDQDDLEGGEFDEELGDDDDDDTHDFDDLMENANELDNEEREPNDEVNDKLADGDIEMGRKKAKWEELAEKIQKVVKKKTEKSTSIMKQKSEQFAIEGEAEHSVKVKKKVSFSDEVVEQQLDSEVSSNVGNSDNSDENVDSDSVLSGESNEDFTIDEAGDAPNPQADESDDWIDFETRDIEGVDDLKEDIYGRLRDSQGNIVKDNKGSGPGSGAYIPPAKRAQMIAGSDEKRKATLDKLRKQMKGLVNRASEANLQSVSSQIEELYLSNSRADVNETFVTLVFDLCVTKEMTPERLSMELMMLVAILHGNVGSEVGAHFLQSLVKKFDTLHKAISQSVGKELDNVVTLLSHLYNFKVVHNVLMFDLLKLLTEQFQEKDVELILLTMKTIGFTLRKDDPTGLKDFIMIVQTKASSSDVTAMRDQSRVRFMLDVLMAIRNNNMRKIPNYDPEHLQHLQKSMKGFLRGGDFGDNQLHVTLQDLINAENKGKWWIVGSAWEGQGPKQPLKEHSGDASTILYGIEISSKLQTLAKKQRMNTDKRRTIFYIIMTSEVPALCSG